jgi:hypothetical protein
MLWAPGNARAVFARRSFDMNKKMMFGLLLGSMTVMACAAQTDPEGAAGAGDDQSVASVSQAQIKATPNPGESCHADGAGVTNGTMTIYGFCCGTSKCDDKETCGSEYGHLVPTCANCDYYKCNPGASEAGGVKPLPELIHVTGVKAVLATDDDGYTIPYRPDDIRTDIKTRF